MNVFSVERPIKHGATQHGGVNVSPFRIRGTAHPGVLRLREGRTPSKGANGRKYQEQRGLEESPTAEYTHDPDRLTRFATRR